VGVWMNGSKRAREWGRLGSGGIDALTMMREDTRLRLQGSRNSKGERGGVVFKDTRGKSEAIME
jgi:hypothetical protein